jgi:hypothetical protein
MIATLGLDPVPATVEGHDLATLEKAIHDTELQWEDAASGHTAGAASGQTVGAASGHTAGAETGRQQGGEGELGDRRLQPDPDAAAPAGAA